MTPAVVLLTLGTLVAPSLPAHSDVSAGVAAYEDVRFEDARQLLTQALAQPLEDADRALALLYLGRVQAIFEESPAATQSFSRARRLDPTLTISGDESPFIQRAWARAVQRVPSKRPPPPKETSQVPERVAPGPSALEHAPPPPADSRVWPLVMAAGVAATALSAILIVAIPRDPQADARWKTP